jgi:hypothetical protein
MFTSVYHRFTEIREAHKQLSEFMRAQVLDKKKEIRGQDTNESDRRDFFTVLVRANETEEGKYQLDDDEVVRTCSAYLHSAEEANIMHRSGISLLCYWPDMVGFILLAYHRLTLMSGIYRNYCSCSGRINRISKFTRGYAGRSPGTNPLCCWV